MSAVDVPLIFYCRPLEFIFTENMNLAYPEQDLRLVCPYFSNFYKTIYKQGLLDN